MNADPLQQSPAHTTSEGRQARCIIQAARAPDRWMIYARSQRNRRACRGGSGGETDALSGLAGAGRLQPVQVQPGHSER